MADEIKFDDVKSFINNNKDSDKVKDYIGGFITPDRVNTYLDSDEGKKLIQPKMDAYFNKGLKTWQENNLDKLVDKKYKEKYPDTDPKDSKIAELEAKFETMQKDNAKKELTNKALKIATEKKLPVDLIQYFVGEDEDTTNNNLKVLEKAFNENVNKVAEERLKSGYKPPKNNKNEATAEEQTKAQINKIFGLK